MPDSGRKSKLLNAGDSVLCVIDVQERLLPAVREPRNLLQAIGALLEGARELAVPVMFTEHCAGAIGPTCDALKRLATNAPVIAKTSFCGAADAGFMEAIRASGRRQVVLAGTEAHVCVLQTAIGLAETDAVEVYIVADAVASRSRHDRDAALERARQSGIGVVTVEMVLFEWVALGDSDVFRRLLPVIKQLKPAATTQCDDP